MTCRKVTGESDSREGGREGQWDKKGELHVTVGKVNGRKKVRADVSKGKPIKGMMIRGRKGRDKRKKRQGKGQRKTEELL